MKNPIQFFSKPDEMPHELRESFIALHREVFGDYTTEFLAEHASMKSPSIFIAADDASVLGFKAGYQLSPGVYYSCSGAVTLEARKQGLGAALMKAQHAWCAQNGYARIQTKTKNKWRDMIILNLKNGFDIIGSYTDEKSEPKLILEKKLW